MPISLFVCFLNYIVDSTKLIVKLIAKHIKSSTTLTKGSASEGQQQNQMNRKPKRQDHYRPKSKILQRDESDKEDDLFKNRSSELNNSIYQLQKHIKKYEEYIANNTTLIGQAVGLCAKYQAENLHDPMLMIGNTMKICCEVIAFNHRKLNVLELQLNKTLLTRKKRRIISFRKTNYLHSVNRSQIAQPINYRKKLENSSSRSQSRLTSFVKSSNYALSSKLKTAISLLFFSQSHQKFQLKQSQPTIKN